MIFLDTNCAIAVMNGMPERVDAAFAQALRDGEKIRISTIVIFELRFGADKSGRRSRNHARIDHFLSSPVEVVPFDVDDAIEAGRIRALLEGRGTPIGPYDLLIATQALRRNAAVVTANTREFSRVPGLACLDWTK